MLFISAEDFFEKVKTSKKLTREEEKECARKMNRGDTAAKELLVENYLPAVAARIKRLSPDLQTLGMIMYCYDMLEKLVGKFNFEQESESFMHRLSWGMRQAVTRYIADK